MKYFFPIHLDSGNRGCEAIAKGTTLLLGENNKFVSLCTDVSLDERMGLGRLVELQKETKWTLFEKLKRKIYFIIEKRNSKRKQFAFAHTYKPFINQMSKEDILISTGGDMLCYDNNQVIFTTNYAHNLGIRTILWGCSMGPENLTKEKKQTLRNFDLIYARESLSYEFFKSLKLKNVVMFPDPAFILEPEVVQLPDVFMRGKVLGLNLSNYVLGEQGLNSPFGRQIRNLIDYAINETDLYILLIPHVIWKAQDDRIPSRIVENLYKSSGRISSLSVDNLGYCAIRYIISRCFCFIGARTHAVISAYSTCTPTIALGYSIKSKGIAKDLSLPSWTVVDSKRSKPDELTDSFKMLLKNEQLIRQRLQEIIPQYCNFSEELRASISKL